MKGDFHYKFETESLAKFVFITLNGIGLDQIMVGTIYEPMPREKVIEILEYIVVQPTDQ